MNTTTKHADTLTARPKCEGNIGNWQQRHMQAVIVPYHAEKPIVDLIRAWLEYADKHAERYEDGIGKDGVLGDH